MTSLALGAGPRVALSLSEGTLEAMAGNDWWERPCGCMLAFDPNREYDGVWRTYFAPCAEHRKELGPGGE